MRLIHNTGADRVIDLMRPHLQRGSQLGLVSPSFSLFAFAELRDALAGLETVMVGREPGVGDCDFRGRERVGVSVLDVRFL